MTERPAEFSLRSIYDEIEKVEDRIKALNPDGRDDQRAADLLNALDQMKRDVKSLCTPEDASAEPTFYPVYGPPRA
ncbi:MAG TPA: hypothetical protein VM364_03730 [Vicinamibacterales bacterium]|nr:hypothetical protein [Vicinamibacterales bacterium]